MSTIDVTSPRGNPVTLHHREGTTDLGTIGSIFELWGKLHDEYELQWLHPRTFLDIGGHIGTVTVAVLVDNPECRAVILEPLPENIELIHMNLAMAGVAGRATVVHGSIGAADFQKVGYTLGHSPDELDRHRFVGSPVADDYQGETFTAKTYPLGELIDLLGEDIDLAKIDCEGCEWVALDDPARSRVRLWVGEYHGNPGVKWLKARLGKAFTLSTAPHDHGATGLFTATRR